MYRLKATAAAKTIQQPNSSYTEAETAPPSSSALPWKIWVGEQSWRLFFIEPFREWDWSWVLMILQGRYFRLKPTAKVALPVRKSREERLPNQKAIPRGREEIVFSCLHQSLRWVGMQHLGKNFNSWKLMWLSYLETASESHSTYHIPSLLWLLSSVWGGIQDLPGLETLKTAQSLGSSILKCFIGPSQECAR